MSLPATPHEAAMEYRRGAWNMAAAYGTDREPMRRGVARHMLMAEWLDEIEELRRMVDDATDDAFDARREALRLRSELDATNASARRLLEQLGGLRDCIDGKAPA